MGGKKNLAKKAFSVVKKAFRSSEGKKVLKGAAKAVKGRIAKYVEAKCPSCGETIKKVASNPLVKAAAAAAEKKIRKECETCGEVLDIIL